MLCSQSSVLERFITSQFSVILLLLNVQFEAKFYVFELRSGLIRKICLILRVYVEFVMWDGGLGLYSVSTFDKKRWVLGDSFRVFVSGNLLGNIFSQVSLDVLCWMHRGNSTMRKQMKRKLVNLAHADTHNDGINIMKLNFSFIICYSKFSKNTGQLEVTCLCF